MDRLQALIRYYRLHHRPRIDQEERWFAGQPTLAAAIRAAALATDWRGNRLPHANRLPATKLKKAEAALLAVEAQIAASRSFWLPPCVRRRVGCRGSPGGGRQGMGGLR